MLHDRAEINRRLAEDIDTLMPLLFGNATISGNYWMMGSINGEPGASLRVWRKGPKQGEWFDFSAGKGGSPIGLVIASHIADGDVGKAFRWAARWVNVRPDETAQEREKRETRDRAAAAAATREAERNLVKLRRNAKGYFLQGVPLAGTLAQEYLAGRAIDLVRLGRQPGALRFHPAMRCPEYWTPEEPVMRPCLLAAVSHQETGELLTVHRHFLGVLANGRVVKANHDDVVPQMSDPKQAYCQFQGGHVPVWRGASNKPAKDMPAGEWITITEGIEDALSIAVCLPERRVWASVMLNNLGVIALPPQCGGIYWHRHRGDHPQAIAAWEKQRAMLAERGIPLREVWAPGDHKDFNDALQALARTFG